MALSAQTLFHFTKFQHLKGIIKERAFLPRLSFETFMNIEDYIVAYPMVCFCDIPLSQIYSHAINYSRNGIGLSKDWGVKKGLNPVFYLQKESFPTKIIQEGCNSIFAKTKKLDNKKIAVDFNNPLFLQKFMDLSAYYKPRIGKTWNKEYNCFLKYKTGADRKTDFYDEREWRYVPFPERPDIAKDLVPMNFFPKELFYDGDHFSKDYFENKNRMYNDYRLSFSVTDVKYIIISRTSDINHMLNFIANLTNYTEEEKFFLMSKAVSLKQIKEDF